MTTENTHYNDSDADATVVEHPSVPETITVSTLTVETRQEEEPSVASDHQPEDQESHNSSNDPSIQAESVHAEPVLVPNVPEATNGTLVYTETLPIATMEEEVRPFTEFIEEFRQTEARFNASVQQVAKPETFTLFTPTEDQQDQKPDIEQPSSEDKITSASTTQQVEEAPSEQAAVFPPIDAHLPEISTEETTTTTETAQEEEKVQKEVVDTKPKERAVSPLLRPATRIRLPRHKHTQRETPEPEPQVSQVQESTPVADVAPITEPDQPKPARRYRFDRPAVSQQKTEEKRSVPTPVSSQSGASTVEPSSEPAAIAEQATKQPPVPEVSAPESQVAPTPAQEQGRRRQSHERTKEQPEATPPLLAASVQEHAVLATEVPTQPEEIAPEDLPPLEYAEIQKASSRRRRRHRSTSSNNSATPAPTPAVTPAPSPAAAQPATSATPAPYTIISGYTVNQMNQGNESSGPFMAPEPSPARGSAFSRTGGSASRGEALRTPSPTYPTRTGQENGINTATLNQFANIITQAIQTQTDRMVAEMRRSAQAPTNVSVSLPPFPSTERVGVFVDVANLLYSARTLRIAVDFGKLLDFLRGNRRLIRAHAYCPTSPQPSDDQMFLQAVKGLGYRITTKNYKTFSSGAKKADLDLDLCMDVVRIVDGRSVDCIVLVSGDSDFMPMLDYCSDHGVRVEVAAFDEAMSATLRQSCDLFINLSMLEEIRS